MSTYIVYMMRLKYILRIRNVLCIVFIFIAISSAAYIVQWEDSITKRIKLREELCMQGAEEFADDILEDVRCFPVKDDRGKAFCVYEDGYGDGRTFGGKRRHEGIDIMSSNNVPGYFAVQSVSDGIVEKKGWLRLGGYRIGIRSDNGIYYYYAHLDSYKPDIKTGDRVKAGDILGYMGDTGYGAEGTRGKFDVHLHFGIYINKGDGEKSVNPYNILRYIEGYSD